jgi:transcriptional regulator with XRE-family HTH domain
MKPTLAKNIKEFRSKLRLTQDELAEYLGVSRVEVNYYENERREVPSELIPKLSNLFGVDEYDLYEEDDAVNNLNIAFAFRANQVDVRDLNVIASFKKIALNYLKIKKALMENE